MKNLIRKVRRARLRKLPVMLALVAALVVPTVIRAYAQEDSTEPTETPAVVEEAAEEPSEEPAEPTTETPTPEDTEEPTTPEDTEVVEEPEGEVDTPADEDPVPAEESPTDALQRYIDFAMAEHPGVEVAEVKFVWKHGVKSAKITFEDGWKVFISVADNSTLKVADVWGNVQKCQRRMRSNHEFFRWYQNFDSYYQWWLSQQDQDDDTEAPTEDEATEEPEVQGTDTTRASSRKAHHYTDWGDNISSWR